MQKYSVELLNISHLAAFVSAERRVPALGNDRARQCGAPIGQRNRPIRLPALRLAQDRGGQITQAAAQLKTARLNHSWETSLTTCT